MRLDKFLSEMGVGTRSQVKLKIRRGLVTVNGETAQKPELQVDENACVSVDGREITFVRAEYYMLNKPAGCVSATEDSKLSTVLDLIEDKKRKDLFPVGRLDRDTEGLLLITNDGALSHLLLSPKRHVDKSYFARIRGCVTAEHIEQFRVGLDIGDEKLTRPADLVIEKSGEESEITITICEGRYHQVKRMFEAIGCEVLYLKRLSMGSLKLDPALKPGEYRKLTDAELKLLEDETRC